MLLRLRRCLAALFEESLAAEATDRRAALERTGVISLGAESLSFAEAIHERSEHATRSRRAEIERALGEFYVRCERDLAVRFDAAVETARQLGRESYLALRSELDGFDPAALDRAAEGLLARTEDAYRDLLGFALRRVDAKLRPLPHGDARAHDLLHLERLPWLRADFPERQALRLALRWLEELGLDPLAAGRIRVDDRAEPTPAQVAAVRVPEQVQLLTGPTDGLPGYRELLAAVADAQRLAATDPIARVEERRLAEPAARELFCTLFARQLCDERWLKRYLELPRARAREIARLAALTQLIALRRACAQWLFERSLYARGVSAAAAEEYAERSAHALFVSTPREEFLAQLRPGMPEGARLLGAWLEAALFARLKDRYDEDYFRNPGAGAFLNGLLKRAGLVAAETLGKELGTDALELSAAGDRLVAVMAA